MTAVAAIVESVVRRRRHRMFGALGVAAVRVSMSRGRTCLAVCRADVLRLRAVTAGVVLVIARGLVFHHQIADWEQADSLSLAAALSRPPRQR